jgi:hypothetical protein
MMVEVMLGFFSLEGNPILCMRELYCDGVVFFMKLYWD